MAALTRGESVRHGLVLGVRKGAQRPPRQAKCSTLGRLTYYCHVWRQRLQRAYNRPAYDEALAALQSLQHELEDRNQSAAGSLAEGLDETLTLHRLGVYGVLGRSLKTTNGLESINALIEEHCAKVDHWQNSSQRHRWLVTALLDIEPRLRKVMGYRHLPKLRDALKRELKIDTTTSKKKAA